MGIELENDYPMTLLFPNDQVVVDSDEEDLDFMFRKLEAEYEK